MRVKAISGYPSRPPSHASAKGSGRLKENSRPLTGEREDEGEALQALPVEGERGGEALTTRPIKAAPGTPFRWRVLWAAFFSYLVDSYDLVVLAIAMPVLLKVLHVPLGTWGLLFSGTMVGAIFGSVLFGLIAENYGRRFALILSLLWLGVAMGLVLFISTWWHLLFVRLFAGIAIGGLWGPCSALIAEHWARKTGAEHLPLFTAASPWGQCSPPWPGGWS